MFTMQMLSKKLVKVSRKCLVQLSGKSDQRKFQHEEMLEFLFLEGIRDPKILKVMEFVPRHKFVPTTYSKVVYECVPCPIGFGQTMSAPQDSAQMLCIANIQDNESVLEVGTGTGYNTALLSKLAKTVYSTEIIPELFQIAKHNLKRVGGGDFANVELFHSDGGLGLPEHAPYDVILVNSSVKTVPMALKNQLATEGRLLVPVRDMWGNHDNLMLVTRRPGGDGFQQEKVGATKVVPMIGSDLKGL